MSYIFESAHTLQACKSPTGMVYDAGASVLDVTAKDSADFHMQLRCPFHVGGVHLSMCIAW